MLGLDAVSNGPLAYPAGDGAPTSTARACSSTSRTATAPDKIREISHRYGSRLHPGRRSTACRARRSGAATTSCGTTGRTSLARRYALQVEEARAARADAVDAPDVRRPGPARGADARATSTTAAASSTRRRPTTEHPAYVLLDPATGEPRELMEVYSAGAGRADARRARAGLPAHQLPPAAPPHLRRVARRPGTICSDWTWTTGEVRELTRAQRAHEPDVSPDGTRIACTVGEHRRARDLALVPIAGGRAARAGRRRCPASPTGPSWSPDGRLIAYSRWKPGGFRDIHVYDLASGRDRALWVDRAMDIDPSFSPDGRFMRLLVGPHRHLQHLRLRAGDRAPVPGDQRAVAARSSRRCRPTERA